jgi:hypothetical protein
MAKLVDPRETDGRLVAQFTRDELNRDLDGKLNLADGKIANTRDVGSVVRHLNPQEVATVGKTLHELGADDSAIRRKGIYLDAAMVAAWTEVGLKAMGIPPEHMARMQRHHSEVKSHGVYLDGKMVKHLEVEFLDGNKKGAVEGLGARDWIADKLWSHFKKLNGGKEPRIISVSADQEEIFDSLKKGLRNVTDDEYVFVMLHSDVKDKADSRTDHRLVFDKAGKIKERYGLLCIGKVALGEYEFQLGFTSYRDSQTIGFHDISIGLGPFSSYRGMGLTSETFAKFAQNLRKFFGGYEIQTVAQDEATEHWFNDKGFFNDVHYVTSDEEFQRLKLAIDPWDYDKVLFGRIPG